MKSREQKHEIGEYGKTCRHREHKRLCRFALNPDCVQECLSKKRCNESHPCDQHNIDQTKPQDSIADSRAEHAEFSQGERRNVSSENINAPQRNCQGSDDTNDSPQYTRATCYDPCFLGSKW